MQKNEIFTKRPNVENQKSPILKAIAYGINAASGHNLQPWKIKILSDTSMLLFVNEKWNSPAIDPVGRLIHISQGTFIETLSIGISALGYRAKVEYFPEGEYSYHEIGMKPVARITLDKPDKLEKDPLYDYIYLRQSNRKTYEGPMITDQELEEIKSFTKNDRMEIITMNDPNSIKGLLDIFYNAWKTELGTYRVYDASRNSMRHSEKERASKRDGLNLRVMGKEGLRGFILENIAKIGGKKLYHSEAIKSNLLQEQRKGMDSARALVFLKSKANTMSDWIIAGRIMARCDLAITRLGLCAHDYSQVLLEYLEMQALQKQFNKKLNIQDGEKVQFVMRIGRVKIAYYTYRRNVEDLLMD